MYDVIIIGGGPAGLSAALVLARCCRKVLLCDHGQPRNYASRHVNGFLSRDGVHPRELLRIGRKQLEPYGVAIRDDEVTQVECMNADVSTCPAGYRVTFAGGEALDARKVLLATGVRDELPDIPGAQQYYGAGVYHCPYCDGWENRGKHIVAYGEGEKGLKLAMTLRHWSPKVTLCTPSEDFDENALQRLEAHGIVLLAAPVAALEGEEGPEGKLTQVRLDGGRSISCDAFFFSTGQGQVATFARDLGCPHDEKGQAMTDEWLSTTRRGCYIAGDTGGREGADVQFAIQAAAKGATAAVGINKELMEEDEKQREREAGVEES